MNRQIEQLIDRYGKEGDFTKVAPSRENLDLVKEELGFSVPAQFLDYLDEYSHGGFGFEILGIGFDGSIAFLDETLEYRADGLPPNLLVVENCDEWLYCIDVNTGEVVSWSAGEEPCADYPSFDDFLLDRVNDAVENMQSGR